MRVFRLMGAGMLVLFCIHRRLCNVGELRLPEEFCLL
jgi:hypothetical protein